jgi:DNA-binding MarR family transcriptional regulator
MSQQLGSPPQVDADVSIDFLIAQVGRMHHKRAHALLEDLGLYHGQPRLLFALWREEGQTQSKLAERLRVRPATITKMLQRLTEAGFVERRRDAADQRVLRVYLTENGYAVQERMRRVWEQMEREALTGFDERERLLLRGFLTRIRDNFRQQMAAYDSKEDKARRSGSKYLSFDHTDENKEKNIEVNA